MKNRKISLIFIFVGFLISCIYSIYIISKFDKNFIGSNGSIQNYIIKGDTKVYFEEADLPCHPSRPILKPPTPANSSATLIFLPIVIIIVCVGYKKFYISSLITNKICSPFIIYRPPMLLWADWTIIVPTHWKRFCFWIIKAIHKTCDFVYAGYIFNIMNYANLSFFQFNSPIFVG